MKSIFGRLLGLVRRLLNSWFSGRSLRFNSKNAIRVAASSQTADANLHGLHGEALALATKLAGKTFYLPNLREAFKDWPMAANPMEKELEGLVNKTLERFIRNEKKLKALKQADFGRLIALWYPHATWEELEVATAYSVWIFVWDDEIDAGDTDISNSEELAREYYQGSLNFIHQKLGLGPLQRRRASDSASAASSSASASSASFEELKADEEVLCPHDTMALFADVGQGITPATDAIQRTRFYRELENFMLQVGVEQTYRLSGEVPSIKRYLEIRSGSVGCAPQIAITDYMLKMRLPEEIMESDAMKSLWKETVVICLILNDVYSVQKEIVQGSMFNIVPVMFKVYGSNGNRIDKVTEELMTMLRDSMAQFELAAKQLTEMTASEEALQKDASEFVEWCRYFITGVLDWSLASRRYGMAKCLNQDESLDIIL
ncbi:isoprenoid synthase domain-containing protein [Xylariales sp. PMI_506]|nr:isoprenoid synthase domain-containing protein [Xylariales sp. PMI_506]